MSTVPSVLPPVLRRLPATTFVVAIGALLAPASPSGATAQAASPSAATSLLERPARLRVRDATLADALGELERRSGVSLAYSPSLLTNKRVQRCACADVTVAGALAELLADTPFTFRESSGEIVIVPIALPDGSAAMRTPIGAAVVSIPSLRLSATTNDAGVYVIPIPSDRFVARSDSLRVTRIGYRPATVRFTMQSGRVTVDVTMSAQAVSLEQVVVTGTAGNQERRAQAAVVSTIDASEITSKAPVLDVNELLYARTPGVSMTKGSGTSGSNTRIDIRGQASISLSNYPLVF